MTEALAEQNLYSLSRREFLHSRASKLSSFMHRPQTGNCEEAHRIERASRRSGEAPTFVQEIGELAEAERHHPNISFGWGNATVSLQTKKIKGLHEHDFIMAIQDRPHIRSHGRSVNEFYWSCNLHRFFGADRSGYKGAIGVPMALPLPAAATEAHCRGRYLGPMNYSVEGNPG